MLAQDRQRPAIAGDGAAWGLCRGLRNYGEGRGKVTAHSLSQSGRCYCDLSKLWLKPGSDCLKKKSLLTTVAIPPIVRGRVCDPERDRDFSMVTQ